MNTPQDNSYAISANRLHDGIVVYLAQNHQWSTEPSHALSIPSHEHALNILKNTPIPHDIIEPYIININSQNHTPSLFREQLRTLGPSVRKDLGRQAEKIKYGE